MQLMDMLRSTGKVGVCIATSGPGATNLPQELLQLMDSTPMVAITGNAIRPLLGKIVFKSRYHRHYNAYNYIII
ncbi:MAG: thiamine pyrophosphate-binding protein [Clostridia bacterium]